jgi:hypothetical protein
MRSMETNAVTSCHRGFRNSGDRRTRLREAKQALETQRTAQAKKVPRDRRERLHECRRRLVLVQLSSEGTSEVTYSSRGAWDEARMSQRAPCTFATESCVETIFGRADDQPGPGI